MHLTVTGHAATTMVLAKNYYVTLLGIKWGVPCLIGTAWQWGWMDAKGN